MFAYLFVSDLKHLYHFNFNDHNKLNYLKKTLYTNVYNKYSLKKDKFYCKKYMLDC